MNCDPLLPTTGSSSVQMILLATSFVLLGGLSLLVARRNRAAGVVVAMVAMLALGVCMTARSASALDCPVVTTTTAAGNLAPVTTTTAPAATSTTAPASTTTSTPTTVAVITAQLTGTYTRLGSQLIVVDAPGNYPNAPGTDWQLPTFAADNGAVSGALVTLRLAGPDNTLDTPDDVVTTTNTAADGSFSFTTTSFGAYRVTLTELPVPDRAIVAAYGWPGVGQTYTVTPWSISAMHTGTIAGGDSITGQDFLASNTTSLTGSAD